MCGTYKGRCPKDILSFRLLTMSSFLAVRFTLRFSGIQMYLALSTAHLLNVPLPLEIQNRCCCLCCCSCCFCFQFVLLFLFICFCCCCIINLLLDTLLSRSVCRSSLFASPSPHRLLFTFVVYSFFCFIQFSLI